MSPIEAARAALAEHDAPTCGWPIGFEAHEDRPNKAACYGCGCVWEEDEHGSCRHCGEIPLAWCTLAAGHDDDHSATIGGGAWVHLRAALAEVDRLTAERSQWLDIARMASRAHAHLDARNLHVGPILDDRVRLLCRDVDRLTLTLRCERGEWAPDGWAYSFSLGQWRRVADPFAKVWRNEWMRRPDGSGYVGWGWEVWLDGLPVEGHAPTALEAIESCDAANRSAS